MIDILIVSELKMKKILKLAVFISFGIFTSQASAQDFIYTKNGYFDKGNEYAIGGYDVTSYFTEGKPVKGSKQFSHKYRGKEWHFKNKESLSLFKKDPQKYTPQYGGHCAWRVAQDGVGVYGDPTIWTIVDGKLYLNYNETVNSRWSKDRSGFIKKGNEYWLGKHKFKALN